MSDSDPYWKLRPMPPTPEDEICACTSSPPVVLQPHLSPNPLSCLVCNLEVPPERIGFSSALAEALAFWRTFHDCFYHLWLDSGEFESWARAQLETPESPVNTRGLRLVAELNRSRRAYYWWFQDSGVETFQPATHCPRCATPLASAGQRWLCESCSIVVAN
jgi:ribosomal protein S27AE